MQYVSSILQKLSDDDNFGCDVNIRSMQNDEVFDMCVAFRFHLLRD